MTIDRRLLEILVCPLTRTSLRYRETPEALVSDAAGIAYPIRGGIPVMLIEEAAPLDGQPAQQ